jgi:hypothetical protein
VAPEVHSQSCRPRLPCGRMGQLQVFIIDCPDR